MAKSKAAAWPFTCLALLLAAVLCHGQGLPRDNESLLAASAAAQSLVKSVNRAQQWRQEAKSTPSQACNRQAGSLCAKKTTAAEDSALLLAASPDQYDLRNPKQTGGLWVLTPVLDQLDCNTCTAFAVGAAAETALAIGLRKNATHWFSPQDFFFCSSMEPGQVHNCRSSWLIEPALKALVKATPTTPGCLPYAPRSTNPCSYKCRDINPDVPTGRFEYARLTSEVDMQQWIRLNGPVLTSMQLYQNHLFGFLDKKPDGIYKSPGSNAKEEGEGHAVVLVGYNNKQKYWVVRSSWGPSKGDDGYIKVAYGAVGIADPSKTWGLRFRPLKPVPAYTPDQISPAVKRGCYNYKAAGGDYFARVAEKFGVPVKQLMVDNLKPGQDLAASLAGQTLVVCSATEVAKVLPPTSQADALLRIQSALDPNNVLRSWGVQPDGKANAYCLWAGITCDNKGNVLKITLTTTTVGETTLGGVLPDADGLLALPKLAEVQVNLQDLSGTLPENYSRLSKLVGLFLGGNLLRGTLPASWAGMKSLQELSLGGLRGTDLKPFGNLLEGTLPPEWGSMSKLRLLGLMNNKLSGPLPAKWGSLRLSVLQLSNNELSGSLPDSWTPLVTGRLAEIALQSNRLQGTLPPKWGSSKTMRTVLLQMNQLSGRIPSTWPGLPALTLVNLGDNQLTGNLPTAWKSEVLTDLFLYGNRFTGPLPVWRAPNLLKYVIGGYYKDKCSGSNRIRGQMPSDLATLMPRLRRIQFPCNQLTGTLPPELGQLSQLTDLDVSSNPGITGPLPSSLTKLSKLSFITVSETGISGTVADSFGDMPALEGLRVDSTKMSGCMPTSLAKISGILSNLDIVQSTTNITGFCT